MRYLMQASDEVGNCYRFTVHAGSAQAAINKAYKYASRQTAHNVCRVQCIPDLETYKEAVRLKSEFDFPLIKIR